jgi:hypothetical protein
MLTLFAKLRHLTNGLAVSSEAVPGEIERLQDMLAEVLHAHPDFAILGNRPAFEVTVDSTEPPLSEALIARVGAILAQPAAPAAAPIVFRRETAFRSNLLGNSVPDAAVGMAPTESFGPFIDKLGRRFWFDVFRPTVLTSVAFVGAPVALRLPIRVPRAGQTAYAVEAGSAWIASTLFARISALTGYYTGLTIAGGRIDLSQPAQLSGGDIVLAPGTVVTLHLTLVQAPVTLPPHTAGVDAAEVAVDLPKTFDLTFDLNGSMLQAGPAKCTVFGCSTSFTQSAKPPIWVGIINQIVVPFDAITDTNSPDRFVFARSESALCTPAGSASIDSALTGWLLPVTKAVPTALGKAAGIGAMCQTLDTGISAKWRGLKGGATILPHPGIIVDPVTVTVLDFAAANERGRLRWDLWRNAKNAHRSRVDLQFGATFPFIFITSASTDSEGVFYFCGHTTAIDRPVDANGNPFEIKSSIAFAAITQTGDSFHAFLLDNDLLLDGKPATADAFRRHSIVLRNALFTVSRPRTLALFGDLTGDRITAGLLALTHDIWLYLPTLPDPYVANYRNLLGDRAAIVSGVQQQALTGFVRWPDKSPMAANAPDPGDPRGFVHYTFSPLLPVLDAIPAANRNFQTGVASFQQRLMDAAAPAHQFTARSQAVGDLASRRSETNAATAASALQSDAGKAVIADLEANSLLRHVADKAAYVDTLLISALRQGNAFAASFALAGNGNPNLAVASRTGFGGDPLMLLDVSTNADLMGITVGPPLEVFRDARGARLQQAQGFIVGGDSTTLAPLQVMNMDVVTTGRYLRAATLPQVSWEPVFNFPLKQTFDPNDSVTTTPGLFVYENDGIPTRIFSESPHPVPIAPLPVTRHFVGEFNNRHTPGQLMAAFTLPFGILAKADFNRSTDPLENSASVDFNMPRFGHLHGGLQIKARAPATTAKDPTSPSFPGATIQLDNISWGFFGVALTGSTLGATVRDIFNNEFAPGGGQPRVPLERIELSGYGTSIFSNWRNPLANTADVSQAQFNVVVGRTAHEVIQVRSILYPNGAHMVRTITLMRSNNGYVFRSDSGWQPESDGFYDFSYRINLGGGDVRDIPNPYEFHTQPVKRVSNIREIHDFPEAGTFTSSFRLDDPDLPPGLKALSVPEWKKLFAKVNSLSDALPVHLQAVVFDADVHLDNVVAGGSGAGGDTIVQSRRMLGYVQIAPSAIALPAHVFAELLHFQNGSLGGPVDCIIDIAQSKQRMRVQRVDVSAAPDNSGHNVFVTAARGALILPADGAWSVVKQQTDTGDVKPIPPLESVPLIKPNASLNFLLQNPADVYTPTSQTHYGVVQSTGTQKLLFDVPQFSPGVAKLKSAQTYFADAYKLLNSKGVFPNVANALGLTAAEREVEIIGEGLMKMAKRSIDLGSLLPDTYTYAFIDEPGVLRIYVQYANTGKTKSKLTLGIDSTAALADRWKAALADMRVIVDLGPFTELMWVDGNFAAGSGASPQVAKPNLQFGPVLQPVVDILQVLATLTGEEFDSGMNVGMSNAADNWEYKFNCAKEIPVIRFPSPDELTLNPNPPLKLEAGLRVGFYFNEVLSIPTDLKQLVPACGAYVEFYGGLQVQCFTLGAASIYGVGRVTLGIAADSKAGITLHMKFGFGAEVVVGLPVVANVSVLYMVEVEVSIAASALDVAGLLLIRGSAEICGGLVAIAIQIEAGGSVHKDPSGTYVIAQVTFSVDVCLLWVIDIDVTEHWQEQRQIA